MSRRDTTISLVVLLLVGVIFHKTFIDTIFDAYFTDHVVNGMKSYDGEDAPAKRLVLIVGKRLLLDVLHDVLHDELDIFFA